MLNSVNLVRYSIKISIIHASHFCLFFHIKLQRRKLDQVIFHIKLFIRLRQVFDFRKAWQFIKVPKVEVVKEVFRRRVQCWVTGHIAMTNDPDPPPLEQRSHNICTNRDPTNLFDIATGDWLFVSYES